MVLFDLKMTHLLSAVTNPLTFVECSEVLWPGILFYCDSGVCLRGGTTSQIRLDKPGATLKKSELVKDSVRGVGERGDLAFH